MTDRQEPTGCVRRQLTDDDREEISRGIAEQAEGKVIAERIGRSPSVVSREIARHGGRRACHGSRVSHGWRMGLRYHRRSRPGNRTTSVFKAVFQPCVPVPDSPPRLLEMFRRPR